MWSVEEEEEALFVYSFITSLHLIFFALLSAFSVLHACLDVFTRFCFYRYMSYPIHDN